VSVLVVECSRIFARHFRKRKQLPLSKMESTKNFHNKKTKMEELSK
jgi:hypothetical protein